MGEIFFNPRALRGREMLTFSQQVTGSGWAEKIEYKNLDVIRLNISHAVENQAHNSHETVTSPERNKEMESEREEGGKSFNKLNLIQLQILSIEILIVLNKE